MAGRRARRAAAGLVCLLALAAAPTAAAGDSKVDRRAFQDAYRGVLRSYAAGDVGTAVDELVTLEAAVEPSPRNMEEIFRLKLEVVRDLLKGGLAVILPIAQLHERAYVAHLEAGRLGHAVHSRTMVAELVDFYADRADRIDDLPTASLIVTSLGARLQEGFMDSTALQLYRRAVDLDPGNTAALLGMGEIFERHGQYEEAVDALTRLVKVDPGHPVGRLRLAVNLRRRGREDEADRILRRLVDSSAADWILAIAYQELGRSLMARGRQREARELLETAVLRLPLDPTLPIQLAYIEERDGRAADPDLGRAVQRRAHADTPDSPRYRYSQMSRTIFEAVRARLRRDESARLPLLAQALVATPSRAPGSSRRTRPTGQAGGRR